MGTLPHPEASQFRVEHSRFEQTVLLLQGGGALGAYQAGVYQALAEANLHPDWVAGISIGAVNAALIAGNPAEKRVEKLRELPRRDTLAFQVDLWSAHGELPRNLGEANVRQKEIQFSSRTRAATDQYKHAQKLRIAFASLMKELPAELLDRPEVKMLAAEADEKVCNIVHLIYDAKNYEGIAKDYEFSRRTMEEHWAAGYDDVVRAISHPEVLQQPDKMEGVRTFDWAHYRDN
jgi:predicted acylesterase/phospholipase RssA